MIKKEWIIKSQGDEREVAHLQQELEVPKIIANLLVQRGVKTFDEAKSFFRPQLTDLHDPFLMKDMDRAIERLEKGIANNEKILIYGDYDVDGTTSVSLIYSFLSQYHSNIGYYIPNRYSEGYGVSKSGVDYAVENKYTLIIALDCGIKAVDRVEYARQHGVDFIICDHHTPGDELPIASAVLDPKRNDCSYPFSELSGCGVGFKLIQAYAKKNNIEFDSLVPYLDLVAVSIASDIVPIIGENRTLAYYGLLELNNNPRLGLDAIIKIAGLKDKKIGIDDIVFKIGPRINAAGRIDAGSQAVDLLVCTDAKKALEMSGRIDAHNQTRRDIDSSTTDEALKLIVNTPGFKDKKSTVLFNPDWHKGVIGIVASRLMETHYRPTVVLTQSNGLATGSARSVFGYDLYAAIDSCSDLLENFGGHMYAAGLTMKIENISAFMERFEDYVAKTITKTNLIPVIEIDTEMSFEDISPKLIRILNQFQPYGPGNMSPIFLTENVYDYGDSKLVGAGKEHLKLGVVTEENPYNVYSGIAFSQADHYAAIKKGLPFDICYSLHENTFNGRTEIQLRVRDINVDQS